MMLAKFIFGDCLFILIIVGIIGFIMWDTWKQTQVQAYIMDLPVPRVWSPLFIVPLLSGVLNNLNNRVFFSVILAVAIVGYYCWHMMQSSPKKSYCIYPSLDKDILRYAIETIVERQRLSAQWSNRNLLLIMPVGIVLNLSSYRTITLFNGHIHRAWFTEFVSQLAKELKSIHSSAGYVISDIFCNLLVIALWGWVLWDVIPAAYHDILVMLH